MLYIIYMKMDSTRDSASFPIRGPSLLRRLWETIRTACLPPQPDIPQTSPLPPLQLPSDTLTSEEDSPIRRDWNTATVEAVYGETIRWAESARDRNALLKEADWRAYCTIRKALPGFTPPGMAEPRNAEPFMVERERRG